MSLIEPFSFGGFRSFPPRPHRLPQFGTVNVIVGQNNSGKSNVLRFVHEHYGPLVSQLNSGRDPLRFGPNDRHLGEGDGALWFGYGIPLNGADHDALVQRVSPSNQHGAGAAVQLNKLLITLAASSGIVWLDYRSPTPGSPLTSILPEDLSSALSASEWQYLWGALTGSQGGDLNLHWIPQSIAAMKPMRTVPETVLVESIRQIGAPGIDPAGFSGTGIINRLAQLQNPDQANQGDKHQFEKINAFVRQILGDASATLEVPYGRDVVLVHQGERTLPLQSLGSGVHEVVILAAAATVLKNTVICIEEPELHLHPTLQRKLLAYFESQSDNQYFVTTHSAALLDSESATIYAVHHDGKASSCDGIADGTNRARVCRDLGYLASDLVQTNCVIWVEGPSDRYYVRHWIRTVDSTVTEGLHYSIMFYGGRLLSHLSPDDPDVQDFISLRRLNRSVAILIDSDKKAPRAGINATKARIVKSIEEIGGYGWVTAGREIENYLPEDVRNAALLTCDARRVAAPAPARYQPATEYRTSLGVSRKADKVDLARAACTEPADLSILDLKKKVVGLVAFIRAANHKPTEGLRPPTRR